MSTVLFAHDGYISITKAGYFSDTYDDKIVERYLNIADKVVFLVRKGNSNYYSKNINKISSDNFGVVAIDNFKSLTGMLKYWSVIRRVKKEVKEADYIVARIPSDLGFLAATYAKKYNKRYMVEVVGCPWDSLRNHSFLGKLLAPYYYLKQKITVKNAPYAIYVTNKFLQNRYPCGGKSVGCSDVEIEKIDNTIISKRIDRIKKTDKRSLVFATIGALHMKYKGYDLVIKTLSKINHAGGFSHKYLIAGGGDPSWLKSVIQKYNAENFVTIVPPMPHEKVFEWIDNIDVYVQPSKTEGMPRALIEAMSRACPCIGSNVGGIPELLKETVVYNNNIQKIDQISTDLHDLILALTIDDYEEQAKLNFQEATKYSKSIIEEKRNMFFKNFILQK